MSSYNSLCDEFFLDMHINTELDLPDERETLLYFFERVQKQFPTMGNFYRRENGEYCLEEDQEKGRYRWVTVEADRIGSGIANPSDLEEVYQQDKFIIELAPYMLGLSHLDIQSLDVSFAMDFDYQGNHDEVIAEALFRGSSFSSLLDIPGAKPIGFSPTVLVGLSDDCRMQARLSIESKTAVNEVRNRRFKSDEAISLYFTVRQYRNPNEKFDAIKSFDNQRAIAEQLMVEKILPKFVGPLTNAIAQRR